MKTKEKSKKKPKPYSQNVKASKNFPIGSGISGESNDKLNKLIEISGLSKKKTIEKLISFAFHQKIKFLTYPIM